MKLMIQTLEEDGSRSRCLRSGFTMTEMLVSIALLLVIMAMSSSVFQVTLQGSGKLAQLGKLDRAIRRVERQLRADITGINPNRHIMAIQGNPAPAWWTHKQREMDNDDNPANGFGIPRPSGYQPDWERTNPTQTYDPLDDDADPLHSFDPVSADDDQPVFPRADILMFIANLNEPRSYILPDVRDPENSNTRIALGAMVVIGHAELGKLNPKDESPCIVSDVSGQPPASIGNTGHHSVCGDYNNVSTNDWIPCPQCPRGEADPLLHIPILTEDMSQPAKDPRPNVQVVAQDWHLARRSVLIVGAPDPQMFTRANQDRYGHFLSPTNPAGNQYAGYLHPDSCAGWGSAPGKTIHPTEAHYLNWILGGEMDVVSRFDLSDTGIGALPGVADFYEGALAGDFPHVGPRALQDFIYEFEVTNRYFGGPGPDDPTYRSWDIYAVDATCDGLIDTEPLSTTETTIPRNKILVPATGGQSIMPDDWASACAAQLPTAKPLGGFFRGPVPAFWLARSHLDPNPPPNKMHRLGHYFLSNCASFKVEWTPNNVGNATHLKEVVWIDPFKEPSTGEPFGDTVTPSSVTKPRHLDEFNMIAQKMYSDPGAELAVHKVYGSGGTLDPDPQDPTVDSEFYTAYRQLSTRFNLSGIEPITGEPMIAPQQSNVFDSDPTTTAIEPGYNTHSWYANDLVDGTRNLNGLQPATDTNLRDSLWPKALRITIDLFDEAGSLETPVRHVLIVGVGS